MTKMTRSLIGKTTIDHIGVRHTVTDATDDSVTLISENKEQSTVDLETMLRHENISQEHYGLSVSNRLTCRYCEAWATDEHIVTSTHRYKYVIKA